MSSDPLATEAGSVQFPLVRHAEEIGWTVVSDTDALTRRSGEAGLFFYDELVAALVRLNPGLVTPESAPSIIQTMEAAPSTIEGNQDMLGWLRGHRTVYDEVEQRDRNVAVIDYEHPERNRYHVTYEWRYRASTQAKGNRADVVFLINGVPVALIENKNPKVSGAMERAVTQLRRYELQTPAMLTAPQIFNVTHLIEYFYGVTWNYERKNIFNWKERRSVSYREAVQSFFEHKRFLTLLGEWIQFFVKDDELKKTVLRQHQTTAVERVVERCADPQRKSGLIWHTQGSGKTFTMITAARLILENTERFPGATVMLVVDRNELEGQLSGWVERLVGEGAKGRGDVVIEYAHTKARMQELLDADFRGLIVSMIHKFDGIRKDSCTRADFFVLIDEAHRSTGGDLGNYLTGALPNATLIGFTGTPIDETAHGKGTFKTFGREDEEGYLHKYSIAESIEDRTTVKLRHALAPNEIRLPRELLETEFLNVAETEGIADVEDLNRILDRAVRLRAFLKSEDRVEKVARFVANHFQENVVPLGYKAFLVAVDREACALYKDALDQYLPPEWSVPVYSSNSADAIDRPRVASQQLDEASEKRVRKAFPKPGQEPRILIVTDKLLTGYDAPILYCMYLDKPMRDHVLLQAVARVNRPYEDAKGIEKPCGLIIDFVGILKELNKALAFDSKEVSGVIEDLDVLLEHFRTLMAGPAQAYLSPSGVQGGKDARLEKLLYGTFLEKEKRDEFTEFFKQVETLYEILSPSPELRDHIDDYNRLADLYVMLRNAYGRKTTFYGDVAHKTEQLVRNHAEAHGLNALSQVIEFDAAALEELCRRNTPDGAKIVNLAKSLEKSVEEKSEQEPYLIPIGERVDAIMTAFDERQTSTKEVLTQLEKLMQERLEAGQAMRESGFDANTFSIFWLLKREKVTEPETLAREIEAVFARFPNYRSNADELRQWKAETYRVLLKSLDGRRMVSVAEQLLKLNRR